MKTLTEAYQTLNQTGDELISLETHYKKEFSRLTNIRDEARSLINLAGQSIDITKVQLAETIIAVNKYTGEGEQNSCVADAIRQFSSGQPLKYNDLWKTYFGTKNYDQWSSQRSDHEYGYGPRHGSTNFSISVRTKKKQNELTPDEVEAVIYYLTNLSNIQAVK